MLTDVIILSVAFAGGWAARNYFGTYAVMKAKVKSLFTNSGT